MDYAIQDNELEFEGPVTWAEVRAQQIEREKDIWDEHVKDAGYSSLSEWRDALLIKYGFSLFDIEGLEWRSMLVKDPSATAARIHTGPYNGWVKYRNDEVRRAAPFAECLDCKNFMEHEGIERRVKELDGLDIATAIALRDPVSKKVVLIDGHHTVSSFAKLYATDRATETKLRLHIADIKTYDHELFEAWMDGKVPVRTVTPDNYKE